MPDYAADLAKYTQTVDAEKIDKLVKHLGIALRTQDGSLVSTTDPEEIGRIRKGFASKKLGLSPEEADAAIAKVNQRMAAAHFKNRVTYYYLLAEETGNLDKI
ncbi:MAG: DUF2853 family protein [Candidatus Nanopelagicales bacterium]